MDNCVAQGLVSQNLVVVSLPLYAMSKIVCVTGASGFISGHVVKQLLAKGYTVRGTVRDASNVEKTAHLMALPGAAERLQLFSASLQDPSAFLEPIKGC